MSHDGYSPMTTVCATSLDRRSHTPEIASKYFALNGCSSSPWPGRTNPPTIERVVMLASVSSSITCCHAASLTAACGRAAEAAAALPPARRGRIPLRLGVDERRRGAVGVDRRRRRPAR